jgi:hypothetical protein
MELSATPGSVSPPDRKRSLGWVAEAAVNLPRAGDPADAFEFTIQRRHVSAFELGPRLLPRGFDYSHTVERQPFQWPRIKVSPSHWLFGVSMGLRF